jgi:polar amino acid transport system substrate-binding protein
LTDETEAYENLAEDIMAKKFLLIFFALSCAALLRAETVEVVTFVYPPLQGPNPVSEIGVDVEIVEAAFRASGVDARFSFIPTKRAIAMVDSGEALAMIGIMEYFDATSSEHLTSFPLLGIDFDVFYLKSKYPHGFTFTTIEDLKPYSIGVLLGGATDIFGKKAGLEVDGAPTLELVFKKLFAGRNDICVAIDLAGWFQIDDIFPGQRHLFGYVEKPAYMTLTASAIFNRNHPQYKTMEPKFREGLRTIVRNGTWEKIVRKYYGKNPVPERCAAIVKEFADNK